MRMKTNTKISNIVIYILFSYIVLSDISIAQTSSDYMLRGIEHFYSYDDSSYIDADEDFTNAIKLNPDYADAYYWRALNYWLTLPSTPIEINRVIRDVNKAIVLNPRFSSAYVLRGDIRFEVKDYDKAVKDYAKAIELDPKNVDNYFSRGYSKYWSGDKEGALKDFNKMVEIKPKDAEVLIKRAEFSKKIGNNKIALSDYSRAIKIDPSNPVAYAARGLLNLEIGEEEQGCLDLLKAEELGLGKTKKWIIESYSISSEFKEKISLCR